MIKLISSKEHLHKGFSGPRISRTDYIETPSGIVAVDHWRDYSTPKLNLVKVGEPRALRAGETP